MTRVSRDTMALGSYLQGYVHIMLLSPNSLLTNMMNSMWKFYNPEQNMKNTATTSDFLPETCCYDIDDYEHWCIPEKLAETHTI